MARSLDEDELIEHWTLVGDELGLLVGRTGPSKLALALWLKFFTQQGRFPEGRAELHDDAVAYVAAQVKVPASDLGLFDWEGSTATCAAPTCAPNLNPRQRLTRRPPHRSPQLRHRADRENRRGTSPHLSPVSATLSPTLSLNFSPTSVVLRRASTSAMRSA